MVHYIDNVVGPLSESVSANRFPPSVSFTLIFPSSSTSLTSPLFSS